MLVSYAQNFEDVILWRALKHVERGFYIDIGAQDPVVDSVSLLFYEHGWRGVHVDPAPLNVKKLRDARPDETVIEEAISNVEEVITFYVIPDTGLSTGVEQIATTHAADGLNSTQIRVKTRRLADLLNDFADRQIHWLKIDVEGMETDVLTSWGDSPVRPWLLVVESTLPRSPEENHSEWEKLVVEIGYEFVYFDGLNRFYVHESHPELRSSFGPGPNVFDDFVLSGEANAPFCAKLNAKAEYLSKELQNVGEQLRQQQVEFEKSQADERATVAERLSWFDRSVLEKDTEIARLLQSVSAQEELAVEKATEVKWLRDELSAALRTVDERSKQFHDRATHLEELAADNKRRAAQLEKKLATAEKTSRERGEADLQKLEAQKWALMASENELAAHRQALENSERDLANYRQALTQAEARTLAMADRCIAIENSTSWQITAPARYLSRSAAAILRFPGNVMRRLVIAFHWFSQGALAWITLKPGSRPRRILRSAFARIAPFVLRRPRLTRLAKHVVAWLPNRLEQKLKRVALRLRQPNYDHELSSVQSRLSSNSSFSSMPGKTRRAAIVAPTSPVHVPGGAERLYAGLVSAIREQGWEADLVTLPFDESSFEAIQAGYAAFEALDLDAYDLVISTKAPSYCVRHRNHVPYLIHTIRVFYDMFETAFPDADESRLAQRRWIHEKDNEALSAVERRYSIGEEVTQRLKSFNGLDARTIHPALNIQWVVAGPIGNYFFMPGRLHRWKRVHLAIEAIRKSELPMKLIIAGTGEDEGELRTLAGGDERIVFVGHVDDSRLSDLYRHCLGVMFCPMREDYGYVTIEAFAYAKPVITCRDSGEPLQFVKDGNTGLVADPNPESIRKAMERLWTDRVEAREMGLTASDVARDITWERVAKTLIDPAAERDFSNAPSKLKVAVLDMQPITPAVGGGRLRLYGLYHDLGAKFDTRYVGSYDWPGEEFRQEQLTPSLKEIVVPLSEAHHKAAEQARRKADGRVVIDMLFGVQGHLSGDYLAEAKRAVEWADIVIFSHPWVAPLFDEDALLGKFVVYDSHNMELDLRSQLLEGQDAFRSYVLNQVESAERLAGDRAHLVLACSTGDAIRFAEKYNWPLSRIELVPNGVFSQRIVPVGPAEKAALKEALDLSEDRPTAFFIGSDYLPNIEAAKIITGKLARACPDILFVIAGGVCERLSSNLPKNVRLAGQLSESDKVHWLNACDIAVNPMISGSGTNIKMFDFAAAGLPIVTSPIGARGIVETSSYGIEVCDPDVMAAALSLYGSDPTLRAQAGLANRHLVESRFSWERLSPRLGQVLEAGFLRQSGRARHRVSGDQSIKTLHISTVGQKCGIGEYTRHLMTEMDRYGFDSTVFTCETPLAKPDLRRLESKASIGWFHDTVSYMDTRLANDIEALIDSSAAELAIIQHHPGFLGGSELRRLTGLLIGKGMRVTVIVHSVAESQIPLLKELADTGAVIISHKRQDLLIMHSHGLEALHLPLAIPTLRKPKSARSNEGKPLTIASNGFLREHKRFDILVDALVLLRKAVPDARLHLLCPLYPSDDSERAHRQIVEAITRHRLEDAVTLDTTFRDKQELLLALSDLDIAVFPYDESAEGGSAAAADAIAAGLPVIVSPSKIFEDLRDTALTCPLRAEAIAAALKDIGSDAVLYRKLATQSQMYAERNSWETVVDILFGVLTRPHHASRQFRQLADPTETVSSMEA